VQDHVLAPAELGFVGAARHAVLATLRSDGRPRLVPICFAVAADRPSDTLPVLYSAIDDKPKAQQDPHRLGRVRDLLARPSAVVLVDHWDEDWSRLAWVRLEGRAELLEPQPGQAEERATAIAALRAKYPQYISHDLEREPIIRITVDRVTSWGALDPPGS
jgi:PPOX class probable F420-dependent enzyme